MSMIGKRDNTTSSIVIVGAGPVGLTVAALLLAGASGERLRLRVLDSGPLPTWDPNRTDLRVYALSRASQRFMAALGLWDSMLAKRVSPYRRMRIWEDRPSDSEASIDFDSADIGEPDLGHIVEDNLLRDTLLHSIVAAPRAELTTNVLLESVRTVTDGVQVGLDNGETIAATLLIAADGSASRVRSLLGMPIGARNYAQQAVVTHVASERPHEETALQRFLPGGPLALLPLADGRSSVVWSMPEQQAKELIGVSDAEFLAALQTASGGVLGELGPISKRAQFSLQMVHALRYCQDSVVLVGDAAHCVHPLAGQGMNLGLLDAVCLADEIERAYLGGRGPGDLAVLRRYERRRKGDNLRMMLAFDVIDRLFRLPTGFAPLRALGLGAVNCSLSAKRVLMRRALGLDHCLARPESPRVA